MDHFISRAESAATYGTTSYFNVWSALLPQQPAMAASSREYFGNLTLGCGLILADNVLDGGACEAGVTGRGAGASVRQEPQRLLLVGIHAESAVAQRPL